VGSLEALLPHLPLVPHPVQPNEQGEVEYQRRNLLAEDTLRVAPVSWIFAFVFHGIWPPDNDRSVALAAHYQRGHIAHGRWFAPIRPGDLIITRGFEQNYPSSRQATKVTSPERERDAWKILATTLPTDPTQAWTASEVVDLLMKNGYPIDEAILIPGLLIHKHSIGRPRSQGNLRANAGRLYVERDEGTFREPPGRSPYPDPFDLEEWSTRGEKETRRLARQYSRR
jgi:hypothetical protein